MVLHFGEITDEDRFIRLENKCTELRKTLMGMLLLAKDSYGDELLKSEKGEEVLRSLEEAEEAFVDTSLTDRFKRLDNIIDVIQMRAKGIFEFIEYIAEKKQGS